MKDVPDPVALLEEEASAAGLVLAWDGDSLVFDGPQDAVTPGMRAVLAAFADELAGRVPRSVTVRPTPPHELTATDLFSDARQPTPAEVLAFIGPQGWRLLRSGPTGLALRVKDPSDVLDVRLAAMIRREPLRGQLLALMDTPKPVTSPGVFQPSPPDRRRRECLFKSGNVVREPEPLATPLGSVVWDWAAGWLPYGSLWERFLGETEWRPIPGRGGEWLPLPDVNVIPSLPEGGAA